MRIPRGFDPSILSPEPDEERLARQYEVVRARTLRARHGGSRRAVWSVASLAGVAIAATAALVVLLVHERRTSPRAGALSDSTVLVSGPSEQPVRVALPEGSQVELAPNTRAKLTSVRPEAVRIDVETGSVDVEATHIEGRAFVVGAGPYEVRVKGTHFRVERIPGERVSVHVDRGVVEVASGGDAARRLGAGEEWSAPDGPAAADPSSSEAPSGEPGATASASVDPAPTSAAPAPQPAPSPVVAAPRSASASLAPKEPRRDAASELFEEGQRARAEGRALDAARAFDRVRKTYRKDPHAALAAFELGRLRLDALADPLGAEEALRDAVVLGPDSPLREDAEARRVEALSRTGDRVKCREARDAYLAHWPSGTYRRTVALYCDK